MGLEAALLKLVGAGRIHSLAPIESLVKNGEASSLVRLRAQPTLLDVIAPGP